MAGGGSGGGSQNTVTQTQQIPAFEQQFAQQNQALAQSLGSQPYPTYGGELISPMNAWQFAGQGQAAQAGTDYQPYLQAAQDQLGNSLNPSAFNNYLGAANSMIGNAVNPAAANAYIGAANQQTYNGINPTAFNNQLALGINPSQFDAMLTGGVGSTGGGANAFNTASALTNPNAVGGYMSPYIQQALAPQISDLQLQLAQQQQGINANATGANAFGDARQGVSQALQNYYGNQALNQLVGTGYNNAYSQALSALGQSQQTQLGVGQGYNQIGNLFANLGGLANQQQGIQMQGAGMQQAEQQIGLQGAQQYANQAGLLQAEQQLGLQGAGMMNQQAGMQQAEQQLGLQGAGMYGQLGNQVQQQGLTGANAVYNIGQQQQTQQQQELNAAYQQYLNQVNWPYQMLNVQESALSNSPYNIATATTLPSANETAQGFGVLAGAAGLLGGLAGGNGNAPFGGTRMQ